MKQKRVRQLGAIWGVIGVIALLLFAVYRLAPFVSELLQNQLTVWQWLAIIAWTTFMLYTEGYQAFQKQFAPRVVARAQYLARHGTIKQAILAPLFCVGYFAASSKRIIVAYSLAVGIIGLIAIVHFIPQPWRGIIDIGVVLGLAYGIVCIVWFGLCALRSPHELVAEPEVIIRT